MKKTNYLKMIMMVLFLSVLLIPKSASAATSYRKETVITLGTDQQGEQKEKDITVLLTQETKKSSEKVSIQFLIQDGYRLKRLKSDGSVALSINYEDEINRHNISRHYDTDKKEKVPKTSMKHTDKVTNQKTKRTESKKKTFLNKELEKLLQVLALAAVSFFSIWLTKVFLDSPIVGRFFGCRNSDDSDSPDHSEDITSSDDSDSPDHSHK